MSYLGVLELLIPLLLLIGTVMLIVRGRNRSKQQSMYPPPMPPYGQPQYPPQPYPQGYPQQVQPPYPPQPQQPQQQWPPQQQPPYGP